MIYCKPIEINDNRYSLSIRVNEKVEVSKELIIPNLKPIEGEKWVYCKIDFNKYGTNFKRFLRSKVNLYFEKMINMKHQMEEVLSRTYKERTIQIKLKKKKKRRKLKQGERLTPFFQSNEFEYDQMMNIIRKEENNGDEFGPNLCVTLSKYEAKILFNSLVRLLFVPTESIHYYETKLVSFY